MSLLGADTKSVLLYVFCSSLRSGLLESGETVSFNGGKGETGRDALCSAQVRGSVCLALQRYVRLTTYGGPPATPPGPPPPLRVTSLDRPTARPGPIPTATTGNVVMRHLWKGLPRNTDNSPIGDNKSCIGQ